MKLKEHLKLANGGSKGYYPHYEDNMFKVVNTHIDEFKKGSGNELYFKARAFHSSSMIVYNFFHWIDEAHPFEWENIKYTQVVFEEQFDCIDGRRPANMDVVLRSEDRMLCIEAKFTEPLSSCKFKIADAYTDKKQTRDIDWNGVITEYKGKSGWYLSGIKQNISHLIALNRFKQNNDNVTIKFVNLVFVPNEKEFKNDFDKMKDYQQKVEDFIKQVEKDINGKVKLEKVVTYREIFEVMKNQISNDLKIYLEERYMKYHE